ncbi:MAG: RIP metalloprotease RseP [Microthrixaceae bacterium]
MSLETPPAADHDPSVPLDRQQVGATPEQQALQREREDMAGVIGSPLGRALRLGALIAAIVVLGVTQGMSMLIVVAAIVIMIFLHELGHYVMAKRAGMLVTEFFIGFGPRIWSFRRGETEYGIKAIPAGAYVKIIGMSNMEEVDPALESRTYRQKSFGQRVGVAVAGSTMHFLIAIVLLVVQFSFLGDPMTDEWSVGQVVPGSAADEAGLQEGDRISSVGGEPIASFSDFRELLPALGPGEVDLSVQRDGQELVVPVVLSQRMKLIGTVGEDVDVLDNGEQLVVAEPVPGGRADQAGLVAGATLTEVNGEPVDDLSQVAAAVASSDDGVVTLSIDVNGAASEHRVDLGTDVATTEPGSFVGVGQQLVLEPQPLPTAVVGAASTFGEVAGASVAGVGKFLWPPNMAAFITDAVSGGPGENTTDTPTSAADGPSAIDETRPISIVGIAMLGSDLSSENISNLVLFLATLNIFIGIFNLFPLLPFDGGHVVIAMYEKAQEMRRRTSQRYLADISRMLPVAYGVIMVLVVVGVLAIFVDVTRGVSL